MGHTKKYLKKKESKTKKFPINFTDFKLFSHSKRLSSREHCIERQKIHLKLQQLCLQPSEAFDRQHSGRRLELLLVHSRPEGSSRVRPASDSARIREVSSVVSKHDQQNLSFFKGKRSRVFEQSHR